jgi:hypothetical protein
MKKAILFLSVSALLMTACEKAEEATLVADQTTSTEERVIDLVEIYGSEEEAKTQLDLMVHADPVITGDENSAFIQMFKHPENRLEATPPAADQVYNMPRVLQQGQTNSCGSVAASIVYSKVLLNTGVFGNYGWDDNKQRSPWYIWKHLPTAFFWYAQNIAGKVAEIGAPSLNQMPAENTALTQATINSAYEYNKANFGSKGHGNLNTWGGGIGGGINVGLNVIRDIVHNYNSPLSILLYTDLVGGAINLDGNNVWNNVGAYRNLTSLHYVTIYGYDDNRQVVLAQNSWGTGWGNNGKFEISYAKLADHWAYNICVAMNVL